MESREIDKEIEEIKRFNLINCVLLYHATNVCTLGLELNEKISLCGIAENAIKRSLEKGLFPQNVCADDVREIFPDVEIPKSEWKNNFISKFCTVV